MHRRTFSVCTVATVALGLLLCARAVHAAPADASLFAADLTPEAILEQVVTATALEPDPVFAAMLVEAAAKHLGQEDAEGLAHLIGGVLLALPEDMARALAPRLVARVAVDDEALLLHLATAAATVLGSDPTDLAAGAHRMAVAALATPEEPARPLWQDDSTGAGDAVWLPLSQAEALAVASSANIMPTDIALAGWLSSLIATFPFMTEADVLAFADAWNLSREDLMALYDAFQKALEEQLRAGQTPIPPPPDGDGTASPW